jgi:hypothetical protein
MKQLVKSQTTALAAFIIGVTASVFAIIPANAASATAAAFDCSAWVNSPAQANARCNLGLGGVRAWADCRSLTTGLTFQENMVPLNRWAVFPA